MHVTSKRTCSAVSHAFLNNNRLQSKSHRTGPVHKPPPLYSASMWQINNAHIVVYVFLQVTRLQWVRLNNYQPKKSLGCLFFRLIILNLGCFLKSEGLQNYFKIKDMNVQQIKQILTNHHLHLRPDGKIEGFQLITSHLIRISSSHTNTCSPRY